MEKTFFGRREVKEFSEPQVMNEKEEMQGTGQILVEYAEGLPQFEAVDKEEWEAGKSSEPLEDKDVALWMEKRSRPLRLKIHKAMEQANPRFGEIGRMLDWVQEAYHSSFKKAVDIAMGVDDFAMSGTFEHVLKAYEKAGEDAFKGRTEVFKDMLEVLAKHQVKVGSVLHQGFLQQMQSEVGKVVNRAFSLALGSDDEHRRCDDLSDIILKYERELAEKAGQEPAPVEGAPSSDGETDGTREDGSGSASTVDSESV